MVFELRQYRHQLRHFLRAFGGRQQEQDRVEIAFFWHDPILAQVVRQNGRWHAKPGILAVFGINTWRGEQQLAGIDKILFAGVALKTVPRSPRLEAKETALAGNHLRGMFLPCTPVHFRRNKGPEHFTLRNNRFPCFNAKRHALRPQTPPALPFVDFGIHIQRREQRVKRAGRGVQHECIIQALMRAKTRLAAQVVIFFVDLRGLGEAGLLFVHRLSHKNARIVFVQLQQQRRGFGHHRDKLLVADPRRVKQNVITQMTDFIDHLPRVVDGAIVGAKLDHRQAERARLVGFFRCNFTDQLTQVAIIETALVDTTNKAERITRGFQIHRRCACLDQRAVMVRLMIIAVEKHQIAASQQCVGHYFVRGRRPVKHKVGFVRMEHFGGKFLRVLGRSFVDQ